MATKSSSCFVVGPIGSAGSPERNAADLLLGMIIRPVVSGHAYTVKRADEDARPGSITQAVIRDVLDADLVIADLTGFNPNAFYELGIRHSTGKPTIHIIGEQVRLPFDNVDQRTIFVDLQHWGSICAAKDSLSKAVAAIKQDGFKDSNPVTQARGSADLARSSDSRDQQLLAMQQRIEALERDGLARTSINEPSTLNPSVSSLLKAGQRAKIIVREQGSNKSYVWGPDNVLEPIFPDDPGPTPEG